MKPLDQSELGCVAVQQMEEFETGVAPKIEDFLRNADLGYADIYTLT